MHGGAIGSGAPEGEQNGAYKHGLYTWDAIQERRELTAWLRLVRTSVKKVD
jgi:hypothetical protein